MRPRDPNQKAALLSLPRCTQKDGISQSPGERFDCFVIRRWRLRVEGLRLRAAGWELGHRCATVGPKDYCGFLD